MTTILVIDDDPAIQKLLSIVLRRNGFDVVTAGNGQSAMRQLTRHPVEVVITDIFMPEKDGLELICEMSKQRPDLKLIAISGGTEFFDPQIYLHIARTLGAFAVLPKPVKVDTLVKKIQELLAADIICCHPPVA